MSSVYFSVSIDLIITGQPMPYDLYVNASKRESKEKFVRIFPIGDTLKLKDIEKFKEKYAQLYIPEVQRSFYLQSLINDTNRTAEEKVDVIKGSAIHHLDRIFDPSREFNTEVLADTITGCKESVESMVEVVRDFDVAGIQSLIANLSFHDFYTYDHSINVSMYCIGILKAIKPNATKEEMTLAGMGGLLHDLGKINIPTAIINFPGKLSDEQFSIIQQHPGYGKDLIENAGEVKEVQEEGLDLEVIKAVVFQHHENFNGTGYPNKIQGEDIHLFARITAIADFFDAITTKRSYHEVLPIDEALHIMASTKGKKIDPKIFDVFARNAKVLVKQGNIKLGIDEGFDPCQPHEKLPLQKVEEMKDKENFGKIKVLGSGLKPKKAG